MTTVEAAYQRYIRLRNVLDAARRTALSQPVSSRNRDLGLINPEDRTQAARLRLEAAFDEMDIQVDRSGILDLCAAFEEGFRRRVATAVGEARRVVGEHYNIPVLQRLKGRLLREPGSFDSLASIFGAIDGLISTELATGLRRLQEERNSIAHQPVPDAASDFPVEDARDLLNEVIETVW